MLFNLLIQDAKTPKQNTTRSNPIVYVKEMLNSSKFGLSQESKINISKI